MTRPARNAPKASDAPAAAVPRAVRVPTRMTAIRNNSLLRVLRISARARGTTVRASTSTLITRSEEHTSELQSQSNLVCRLLLEQKQTCCALEQDHCSQTGES